MGTSPAAVLARIKAQNPAWTIRKTSDSPPRFIAQRAAVPGCAHGNVARPPRRVVTASLAELGARLRAPDRSTE